MLRHYSHRLAQTISLLPSRVESSCVETVLVVSAIFALVLSTGLFTASWTAVTLSVVTRLADEERHPTAFVAAEKPEKNDRFGGHLGLSKALDDGRPNVRG